MAAPSPICVNAQQLCRVALRRFYDVYYQRTLKQNQLPDDDKNLRLSGWSERRWGAKWAIHLPFTGKLTAK
jgi:hypothetical protein